MEKKMKGKGHLQIREAKMGRRGEGQRPRTKRVEKESTKAEIKEYK